MDDLSGLQGHTAPPFAPIGLVKELSENEPQVGLGGAMGGVLFRPWAFFSRTVQRLSIARAIFLGLGNLGLAGVVVVASPYIRLILKHLSPHMVQIRPYGYDLEEANYTALGLGIAWAVVAACYATGPFLYAPAMSGAERFSQALRRSLAVIAGTTCVLPVLAAAVGGIVVFAEPLVGILEALAGDDLAGPLAATGLSLLSVWPVGLLFVALMANGRKDVPVLRRRAIDGCEKCGYLLTVIPEERQCPDCGWPVDDSLNAERRVPLLVETASLQAWPGRALATFWSGFWRPSRLWWRSRVRAGSVAPRTAFLVMLVLGTAVGSAAASVLFVGSAAMDDLNDFKEVVAVLVPLVLWWWASTSLAILAGSHVQMVLAVAVARLRGNSLRLDELARVGYCSLGLPALVLGVLVPVTLMLWPILIRLSFNLWGPPPSTFEKAMQIAVVVTLLGGFGLMLATMVASLVSTIRAMQAARHANH
ncbi:MAG: hypothetical protein GXY74_07905 [Phycisphaerae bacterium]|nr:hypothetical protein [Phycisphaerae bacterium]